jgi:hypothetical protein
MIGSFFTVRPLCPLLYQSRTDASRSRVTHKGCFGGGVEEIDQFVEWEVPQRRKGLSRERRLSCGAPRVRTPFLRQRVGELQGLRAALSAGLLTGASRTPRDVMVKDAAPPGQIGKVFGFGRRAAQPSRPS